MRDIIEICSIKDSGEWMIVANSLDSDLAIASLYLLNDCNEYVEKANSGIVYRFIRRKDLSLYDRTDVAS